MSTYSIIQNPTAIIVGISCKTSNDLNKGPIDIPNLWARFTKEGIFEKIPNKTSNDIFALYCDYEGDYTMPYTVVIGCKVNSFENIPEEMVARTIPSSSYAIFTVKGDYPDSLIKTWNEIWKSDLKRTYICDYELYGSKFLLNNSKELDVYIGIDVQ